MKNSTNMLKLIKVYIRTLCKSSKILCWIVIGLFFLEIFLFHSIVIYSFFKYKNYFLPIYNPNGRDFVEKFTSNKFSKDVIFSAKYGGLSSLLQNTLERVYIANPESMKNDSLVTFRLDVSHSGEFLFLYRRILSRKFFPYSKLVIDIGANDGFLSSNSFNFIQHGWNAILVEPQSEQINLARYHLSRYTNVYNDNKQYVMFEESVLGSVDGAVKLVITSDLAEMESHILSDIDYDGERKHMRTVQCMTVATFVQKYDVPKFFGVLSIDAEGTGSNILHQFIEKGFRPGYIIYEGLHEREESIHETNLYLMKAGYKFMTKRGWNFIYEQTGKWKL